MLPLQHLSSEHHVAVLGFGVTGLSVARYFSARGVRVTVMDTRVNESKQASEFNVLWDCQRWPDVPADIAVVSPGLSMNACLVQGAQSAGVPVYSDIDVFFAVVDKPVIGITGTNGKSTVTSLVGHLINEAGTKCAVGGNLGTAALDLLVEPADCYALELSSFQLERSQLHAYHAASVLNISEDHLDKHMTMQAYAHSKQRIYAHSSICIYNRDDVATMPNASEELVSFGASPPPTNKDWGIQGEGNVRYFVKGTTKVCPVEHFSLPGRHNELNALAACALSDGLVSLQDMGRGLASFKGLAHRFEIVSTHGNVTYINDSKATNLGAALAALAGMERRQQVILIAGGDAKGVNLAPLTTELKGRVRLLVTLGKDASALQEVARQEDIATTIVSDMTAAVSAANDCAISGDVVLLSPACASIDMYANYAARGDAFRDAVHALQGSNKVDRSGSRR